MDNSLFDDLCTGLQEAIEYEKGTGPAKKRIYSIEPITEFSSSEIREIRNNAGMTQSVFAEYFGVSKKTVEAWECGRTHPTGPAFRLLNILKEGNIQQLSFIKTIRCADNGSKDAVYKIIVDPPMYAADSGE